MKVLVTGASSGIGFETARAWALPTSFSGTPSSPPAGGMLWCVCWVAPAWPASLGSCRWRRQADVSQVSGRGVAGLWPRRCGSLTSPSQVTRNTVAGLRACRRRSAFMWVTSDAKAHRITIPVAGHRGFCGPATHRPMTCDIISILFTIFAVPHFALVVEW